MADLAARLTRLFRRRYRGIPAAVLLPQLFLAVGWLRAAIAHGLHRTWWNGEEVLMFVTTGTADAIGVYEPFLSHVVRPLPALTAAIVFGIQLLVGLMLILNVRVLSAVMLGAFLNLHFILSGVVNPSIFYLVMALVVVLWRMERTVSLSTSRRMAKVAAVSAGVATVCLLPFIANPTPDKAIEDPALVLILLSLLFATSTWWTSHRIAFD